MPDSEGCLKQEDSGKAPDGHWVGLRSCKTGLGFTPHPEGFAVSPLHCYCFVPQDFLISCLCFGYAAPLGQLITAAECCRGSLESSGNKAHLRRTKAPPMLSAGCALPGTNKRLFSLSSSIVHKHRDPHFDSGRRVGAGAAWVALALQSFSSLFLEPLSHILCPAVGKGSLIAALVWGEQGACSSLYTGQLCIGARCWSKAS